MNMVDELGVLPTMLLASPMANVAVPAVTHVDTEVTWFVLRPLDDERFEVESAPDESVGSLSWEYRLAAAEFQS